MNLATFGVPTPLGRIERVGAALDGGNRFVDLNAACAAMCREHGDRRASERAALMLPPTMTALLGAMPESLETAREVVEFVSSRSDELRGPNGEQLVYPADSVQLLAPVPHPP